MNPETVKELTIDEVYPYLRVHDAAGAIEFYKRAFDATELFRLTEPSGRIGHAELKLGPATIMLSDEYPEHDIRGPHSIGGTSVGLHIHCSSADDLCAKAVAAGATIVTPLKDQFYGERSARLRDPYGHHWLIGSHIEDVPTDEMQRRYTEELTKG
jgi:uncharacterized glyoxalase superfamily protein PhnB